MFLPLLRLSVPLLLVVTIAPADARRPPSTYVDLADYPRPEANLDRFHDLERRLESGFDQVCGDTFCEGEFSNYRPMQLRCSVHAASGAMRQCRWIFAASTAGIDGSLGAVDVDARTWNCLLPLPTGLGVEAFHGVLGGPDAIDAPLPGGAGSIYESLTRCLH